VKEVLGELHGGSVGGYMYANKTLEQYYWLCVRGIVER
jgi:hypothetical protein